MRTAALAFVALLPPALAWVRDDDVGKLPAMGWNSWNAYHCDVDQEKIMAAANAMVSRGFKDAGYVYVNSDDCWANHLGRDNTTNRLLPNMTKFPEGIKGLADKVHDLGMKFGIYSTAGVSEVSK
jgi:alpha-galactosidase